MLLKSKFEVVPIAEIPSTNDAETHRPVVLIVDDERIIADSLAAILKSKGLAPLVAYNGESALEIASISPPQLLISDVVMPGMTGIQLAIALTTAVPDCKVLLFSGQAATAALLADAYAQGHAFKILSKPIHPKELLARISECLVGFDAENRLTA